jgi:hypothetical protein
LCFLFLHLYILPLSTTPLFNFVFPELAYYLTKVLITKKLEFIAADALGVKLAILAPWQARAPSLWTFKN